MSAIVDYTFYSTVYIGKEVDETSFPAFCARAEDIVGAMTRWAVNDSNINNFPAHIQMLYKKAICAQVDFLGVNGIDSVSISASAGNGFTVGKVSVHGGNSAKVSGAMQDNIAPMARMYLEQTGLLSGAVGVLPDMPLIGWWL